MPQYSLYRLPDTVFWTIVLCGVLLCVCDAVRQAFQRRPSGNAPPAGPAARDTAEDENGERHTHLQRIFHWANFVTVAILLLSGLAIYRSPVLPFLQGSAAAWFSWHRWVTPVFLALVLGHILYEYRAPDHIDHVWFGREEYGRLASIVKRFFGLAREYPLHRKYHPAQILFHWAIACNLFALVLTGFVLWKPFRALLPLSLLGLGWDFIFYNRILHAFLTATLMTLIVAHMYFALCVREHRAGTRFMITGKVPREKHPDFRSSVVPAGSLLPATDATSQEAEEPSLKSRCIS